MYVNYNNSRAKKKRICMKLKYDILLNSFFLLTTAALWLFDPFFLAM